MKIELHEVVMKLVGPVQASGDSSVDVRRLQNMGELIELVDQLLGEIFLASGLADRQEASMSAIGKRASDFLMEVHQEYVPAKTKEGHP